VIIAFETGFVPPNINFTSPRKDIKPLMDGTICVVTEAMPLKNGYIGMNSFGFGGANAHMLLQWNVKKKINNGTPTDDLPRLVVLSGPTEESVKLFLNDVSNYFRNNTNIKFNSKEHCITYTFTFIVKTFILRMRADC